MAVIILAGAPAVGKSALAELIGSLRSRVAVVEVDDVRAMVRQPHVAPWEGEEGAAQYHLGITSSCRLARGFMECGYEVLLVDVVPPETLGLYHAELLGLRLQTVLLRADSATLLRRDSERALARINKEAWQQRICALARQLDAESESYDLVLDTGVLTREACAIEIGKLLDAYCETASPNS